MAWKIRVFFMRQVIFYVQYVKMFHVKHFIGLHVNQTQNG